MKRFLVILMLAVTVAACGGSSDEPEPTPSSEAPPTTEAPPAADVDWTARVAKWERDNAVSRDDYFVDSTTVTSSVLDIRTTLEPDDEGKDAAKPVCGTYSTIVVDYPEIEVVRVLAKNGGLLTKCGPGA